MKTLKDVKVGETATVARLHGEGPVKRRIMDMGITKGGSDLCAQGSAAWVTPWSLPCATTS